ncbi:type IV pilin protein [Romboutsia ilealis]|uniref:type IV pilin protein n=1 Tax=Romboutsia ilealis TaxID=1115758 RepID=UPI002674A570|nr:prepilin-type N-terminal cleavage/methylation domain-containing protein [Romboutsia ilealis]
MKKNNKGFTLVELLVVIAIIGILAVLAVPALFKNIEKGKIADLEADISAIRSAALSVYADTSAYPSNFASVESELEGLSKPFGGTYGLQSQDVASKGKKLTLTITDMNQISANGIKKLRNDLGDKLSLPERPTSGSNEQPTDIINIDLILP